MALVTVAVCVRGAVEERELQRNGWDRRHMWTTPDPVMHVYAAVNLPSVCVAFLPFTPYTDHLELDWNRWYAVLLVLLLVLWLVLVTASVWYYLGRWIDRQVGWLPASEWRGTWASVIGAGIGVALAAFLTVMGALAGGRDLTGFSGWAGFAAFATGMHIRRVLPGLRKGYSS